MIVMMTESATLQPPALLAPIPALVPLPMPTQPMIKAMIAPMKIMVASPLIVLSWVIVGELDMIDRVGRMATVLIRARMKAAWLKLLPSCCVVVVGVVLGDVVVVVLGGVPGPEERTICILLPVGLLPAPIALTGVFTGAIAPVVRIMPVVPVAPDDTGK